MIISSWRFNLNREAAPLATELVQWLNDTDVGFNLNREAAPLATNNLLKSPACLFLVSISTEKPLH